MNIYSIYRRHPSILDWVTWTSFFWWVSFRFWGHPISTTATLLWNMVF